MAERRINDSTRDLLDEVDSGWFSSPPPRPDTPVPPPDLGPPLSELSPSVPDVAELDAGWLDETPRPRPQVTARLDPESFARAKREQQERAEQKRHKKRTKAADKRARQLARAEAVHQKQKAKRPRPAPVPKATSADRRSRAVDALQARQAFETRLSVTGDHAAASDVRPPARSRPSTTASLKVLVLVLALLIAGAIGIAALLRH